MAEEHGLSGHLSTLQQRLEEDVPSAWGGGGMSPGARLPLRVLSLGPPTGELSVPDVVWKWGLENYLKGQSG